MASLVLVTRGAEPLFDEVPPEFAVPLARDDDDLVGLALARIEGVPAADPLVCFAFATFGVPTLQRVDAAAPPLVDFELRPWQLRHATPVRRAGTNVAVFATWLAMFGASTSARANGRSFVGPNAVAAVETATPFDDTSEAPTVVAHPIGAEPPLVTDPPASVAGNLNDAFESLAGHDVRVQFYDGSVHTGTVLGTTKDSFTLVDAKTGRVRVYRRAAVIDIYVKPLPQLPHSGLGMLIPGSVLTGVGVPTMVAGAVFLGLSPSYPAYGLVPMLIGATATVVGITLTVIGAKRHTKWRKVREELRQRRVVHRPQWAGGLSFRF